MQGFKLERESLPCQGHGWDLQSGSLSRPQAESGNAERGCRNGVSEGWLKAWPPVTEVSLMDF